METERTNKDQATLDLGLTANGSAVIERFHMTEQGKPIEMISLYYLDGE